MISSAGLLIYDWFDGELKFLLVHPGGPYWKNKPEEGWGIPKGKIEEGEVPIEAAIRETWEETGSYPSGELTFDLGIIYQRKGKTVQAWGWHGRIPLPIKSNILKKKIHGKIVEFPEIDKGEWFTTEEARSIIISKQFIFIERLLSELMSIDYE